MNLTNFHALLLFSLLAVAPIAARAQAPAVPAAPAKPAEFPTLLAPGTLAPDFTCVAADGKEMKLSDLRGKVVILDFWASWCVPCQKTMPHLERVYRQVKDKDVVVLALCVRDDKSSYEKWRVDHKTDYTFPVALDTVATSGKPSAYKSPTYLAYGVPGIPTQYVIDKDGKIVAGYVGYNYKGDTRLEAALATVGVVVATATASK